MADYTSEELARMCRSPRERLAEMLRDGSADDVTQEFTRLLGLVRDIADLYARWSVATLGWLAEHHGLDAAAAAAQPHELCPTDAPRLDGRQLALVRSALLGADDEVAAQLDQLARAGSEAPLLAYWDEVLAACDCAETIRRDHVTAQLTLVHARYGADGLEACLRRATDLIWAPRMARDLACAPTDRVRSWADKMSVGHQGTVSVVEHDDCWVFTLDPCGSCGRQLLAGRYAPPWDFGVVAPGQRVGFLRPDITVYQAHLAVAHTLVPIERTGAPWPAMACSGLAGGPCELVIYRDPARTAQRYYAQVGATR